MAPMAYGWLLVLGFVIIQLAMYALFKRWRHWVWSSLSVHVEEQLGLSLEDVKKSRGAYLLEYKEDRKKMIWFVLAIVASIFLLIDLSFVADESAFDRPDAVQVFVALFLICDVGSAVVWLGFLNPYGNIRIVTSDGILKRQPYFLGTEFVKWSRIKWVRRLPFANWGYIVRTDRGWFQVLQFLSNFDEFRRAIMANVPREKWEKTRRNLRHGFG